MLIMGILYRDSGAYEEAVSRLKEKFGPFYEGVFYPFTFTSYYEAEMGKNLMKKFIAFENGIDASFLADIKVFTNRLEDSFRADGKRRVNIDPGCLTDRELVLASVKPKPYKTDIGKGIYAHIVLRFANDAAETFYHTFPDFKSDKARDYFLALLKTKHLRTMKAL